MTAALCQSLQSGLTFNEAAHSYALDGRRVVSVTQCLKPWIESLWFTEDARHKGQCVHRLVELYELDMLDETTLHESLKPYLAAWLLFKSEMRWSTLAPEMRLAHRQYLFAGTIDNFGTVKAEAAPCTLDLKSSLNPCLWWALQVSGGYDELIRHNAAALPLDKTDLKHLRRLVVILKANGTYRLIDLDSLLSHAQARDEFLAALKLTHRFGTRKGL